MSDKTMPGTICISIDLELLWGRRAGDYQVFLPSVRKERNLINKLLELFHKNSIHVTWATVGHLMLFSCKKIGGVAHPEIIRSALLANNEDWFSVDPGGSLEMFPGWYGADIVELIEKYPEHEIGSHSFSHTNFGHKKFLRGSALSELRASKMAAKAFGITLHSFVFPYNEIGYLALLKENGFLCFRGKGTQWYSRFPKKIEKFFQLVDLFLPVAPMTSVPKKTGGLVDVPSSFYYMSSRGLRRFLPKGLRFRKIKLGIDHAEKYGTVFHLWFHPVDLLSDNNVLFDELSNAIEYAGSKIKKGTLVSRTMYEIAKSTK